MPAWGPHAMFLYNLYDAVFIVLRKAIEGEARGASELGKWDVNELSSNARSSKHLGKSRQLGATRNLAIRGRPSIQANLSKPTRI